MPIYTCTYNQYIHVYGVRSRRLIVLQTFMLRMCRIYMFVCVSAASFPSEFGTFWVELTVIHTFKYRGLCGDCVCTMMVCLCTPFRLEHTHILRLHLCSHVCWFFFCNQTHAAPSSAWNVHYTPNNTLLHVHTHTQPSTNERVHIPSSRMKGNEERQQDALLAAL